MDDSQLVTLKIPRPLYERLSRLIEGTGFRSVTQFVTYILRDLASSTEKPPPSATATPPAADTDSLTAEEVAAIRKRLQQLGYL